MGKLKRNKFSYRNNLIKEDYDIQYDSMSKESRISIFNFVVKIYKKYIGVNSYDGKIYCDHLCSEVLVTPVPIDGYYTFETYLETHIKTIIFNFDYDDILYIFEDFVNYWNDIVFKKTLQNVKLFDEANNLLKTENIGYRFVDKYLLKITDENEIFTINEAIHNENDDVYIHINKAMKLLSDKTSPDYSNSIKESITAIETYSKILIGKNGKDTSLGALLKKFDETGIKIHPSLKSAFEKLYGYTSDAKGIRHAGDLDGPNATFSEAKFMLVSSCAFINYLKSTIIIK